MVIVLREGIITASRSEVWEVLADYAWISRWAPNVDHSSLMTDVARGVGAVRRIQTGGATVLETVETWEPGVGLSYDITGLPPVVKRVVNTWRLEASGDRTRVALTTDVVAGSRPPQRLLARAVGRRLGDASEQMIAGLSVAVGDPMVSGAARRNGNV